MRPLGLRARFVVTATDQCVASLSNFAVGVAIARIAGIAALGAYSLAYVIWLALADVHRSLVTDPMAIENDVRRTDPRQEIRIGMAAELSLGLGLAAPVAALGLALLLGGQHAYGVAFLALAPWLPFLLVQDYWRWVGFMKGEPEKALVNDVVFDVVQAGAFGLLFVVGLRSSVLAIGAWGVGALAGSLLGLRQHAVGPAIRGGIDRMRRRWGMTRWLLGGSLTTWGASQAYVVLTGAMLGPAGIGGLRAALSLVNGPSVVLLQAGGSVGLPEASRALREHGWGGLQRVERIVSAASVASVVAVGLVVLFFGRTLLVVLYGHQFAKFASTADLLALSVLIGTLSVGAVLALKATRLTGMLFRKSALSLVTSIVSVAVLVPLFGVLGAAGAAVARSSTSSVSTWLLHLRFSRRAAEQIAQGPAWDPEGPREGPDRATRASTVAPLAPAGPRRTTGDRLVDDPRAAVADGAVAVPGPSSTRAATRATRG
jgi:O-antigen/teichoic acid export membrane protein